MNFYVDKKYLVDTDSPLIVLDYTVLMFDEYDDMPILFVGKNPSGKMIIGSIMSEDDDKDIFRYVNSIVNDDLYKEFISGLVSYREAIEKSENVFLVDKDINDNICAIYDVPINTIDKDYLPLPNYFFTPTPPPIN